MQACSNNATAPNQPQETPFHKELVVLAKRAGVTLALLNAHMPGDQVLAVHVGLGSRQALRQALRSYSLIVPRSDVVRAGFIWFG